jgi:hypothetical protein
LLKLAENVLGLEQVVDDNLMGFFSSYKCPNKFRLFVLKQSHLSYPSKIVKNVPFLPFSPPSVDFRFHLEKNFLILFTSDNWNFWKIDFFPISDYFSLWVKI